MDPKSKNYFFSPESKLEKIILKIREKHFSIMYSPFQTFPKLNTSRSYRKLPFKYKTFFFQVHIQIWSILGNF